MNTAKMLFVSLILALVSSVAFAETNPNDGAIRSKMVRQIASWSASHGGANITYEHIVTGYGTTLDATMRFSTADGQLQCEKVGFSIAVCQNQNGQTVTLPGARSVDTRKFGMSEADGCPPQMSTRSIDLVSHHCRQP